jgi:hypothetical protein
MEINLMSSDLIMFTIGMFMALFVSFLGMMLAYFSYRKHDKGRTSEKLKE